MRESESGKAFLDAMALLRSGEQASKTGDYKQAVARYERAIAIAEEAPGHDWDQRAFLAMCHAILAGPLLSLGRTEAGLRAADKALEFYDRYGDGYPAERERWFATRRNKAATLTTLRRFDEAVQILEQARAMLSSTREAEPVRKEIDDAIASVRAMATRSKPRSWWRPA